MGWPTSCDEDEVPDDAASLSGSEQLGGSVASGSSSWRGLRNSPLANSEAVSPGHAMSPEQTQAAGAFFRELGARTAPDGPWSPRRSPTPRSPRSEASPLLFTLDSPSRHEMAGVTELLREGLRSAQESGMLAERGLTPAGLHTARQPSLSRGDGRQEGASAQCQSEAADSEHRDTAGSGPKVYVIDTPPEVPSVGDGGEPYGPWVTKQELAEVAEHLQSDLQAALHAAVKLEAQATERAFAEAVVMLRRDLMAFAEKRCEAGLEMAGQDVAALQARLTAELDSVRHSVSTLQTDTAQMSERARDEERRYKEGFGDAQRMADKDREKFLEVATREKVTWQDLDKERDKMLETVTREVSRQLAEHEASTWAPPGATGAELSDAMQELRREFEDSLEKHRARTDVGQAHDMRAARGAEELAVAVDDLRRQLQGVPRGVTRQELSNAVEEHVARYMPLADQARHQDVKDASAASKEEMADSLEKLRREMADSAERIRQEVGEVEDRLVSELEDRRVQIQGLCSRSYATKELVSEQLDILRQELRWRLLEGTREAERQVAASEELVREESKSGFQQVCELLEASSDALQNMAMVLEAWFEAQASAATTLDHGVRERAKAELGRLREDIADLSGQVEIAQAALQRSPLHAARRLESGAAEGDSDSPAHDSALRRSSFGERRKRHSVDHGLFLTVASEAAAAAARQTSSFPEEWQSGKQEEDLQERAASALASAVTTAESSRAAFAELSATAAALRQELATGLADLRDRVDACAQQRECDVLQDWCEALHGDIQEARRSCSKLEEDIIPGHLQALRQQRDEVSPADHPDFQRMRDSVDRLSRDVGTTSSTMQSDLDALHQRLDKDIVRVSSSMQSDINALHQRLDRIQEKLEDVERKPQELQGGEQLRELQEQLQQLQQPMLQHATTQSQPLKLRQELADLAKRIGNCALAKDVSDVKNRLHACESLQSMVAALVEDVANVRVHARDSELRREKHLDIAEACSSLREEVASLHKRTRESDELWREKHMDVSKTYSSLREEIAELRTHARDAASWQQKQKDVADTCHLVQQEIAELRTHARDAASWRQKQNDVADTCHLVQQEAARMLQRVEALEGERERGAQHVEALEERVAFFGAAATEARSECDDLRVQVEAFLQRDAEAVVAVAEASLRQLTPESSPLPQPMPEDDGMPTRLQLSVDVLQAAADAARADCGELQQVVSELLQRLEVLEDAFERLPLESAAPDLRLLDQSTGTAGGERDAKMDAISELQLHGSAREQVREDLRREVADLCRSECGDLRQELARMVELMAGCATTESLHEDVARAAAAAAAVDARSECELLRLRHMLADMEDTIKTYPTFEDFKELQGKLEGQRLPEATQKLLATVQEEVRRVDERCAALELMKEEVTRLTVSVGDLDVGAAASRGHLLSQPWRDASGGETEPCAESSLEICAEEETRSDALTLANLAERVEALDAASNSACMDLRRELARVSEELTALSEETLVDGLFGSRAAVLKAERQGAEMQTALAGMEARLRRELLGGVADVFRGRLDVAVGKMQDEISHLQLQLDKGEQRRTEPKEQLRNKFEVSRKALKAAGVRLHSSGGMQEDVRARWRAVSPQQQAVAPLASIADFLDEAVAIESQPVESEDETLPSPLTAASTRAAVEVAADRPARAAQPAAERPRRAEAPRRNSRTEAPLRPAPASAMPISSRAIRKPTSSLLEDEMHAAADAGSEMGFSQAGASLYEEPQ
eukprot:TRINITY_DN12878_c0_g1_i1.p1 TRINITY_DN12878_c0_g1~~TRINITY_DN12878_c0_g1_i1.p1  ORF type:complete len:1747 (-),score=477.76 TRINITY_DN12878_c0_g1_i1:66-5306(-)